MKFLCFLVITLAMGMSMAEDEKPEINRVRDPMDFYKCLACGDGKEEVREEYVECKTLKPKFGNVVTDDCKKEIIPKDELESWSYICENPEVLFVIMDCVLNQAVKFTEGDMIKLEQYQECVNFVESKYCSGANQTESAVTESNVAQAAVTQ